MAIILPIHGKSPQWGENEFIAPNATLVGDIVMGNHCSVWFGAVLRADVNAIRIGNNVNIQDNATIHCTYQKFATTIGDSVSIGHNAIVHGCHIHSNVLVGMGAIIMDGTIVHENVVIAAGAVVVENSILEEGFIYAGIPAKKLKPLPENIRKGEIERIANNYLMYASWYKKP